MERNLTDAIRRRHERLVSQYRQHARLRRQEVERQFERERQFVQKFLADAVPVRIQWDDKAWREFESKLPVKISWEEPEASPTVVVPEVIAPEDKKEPTL